MIAGSHRDTFKSMKTSIQIAALVSILFFSIGCNDATQKESGVSKTVIPAQPGGAMTPEQEKELKAAEAQSAAQSDGMASLMNKKMPSKP